MSLHDSPLSPEAAELLQRLRPRIAQRMQEVSKIPLSILVWGPGIEHSATRLGEVRAQVRSKLRENGHAAMYSEELYDSTQPFTLRMQELLQAIEFDLIVSIPGSPGSIGEIHDFAADARVSRKLLAFLNKQQITGYSAQSIAALSSITSCRIIYYPSEDETHVIIEVSVDEAQRLRETKYILAGRT